MKKILYIIILTVLCSVCCIFLIFKSPFIQTKIIKKLTTYIQDYLHTKVEIGSVDFTFFNNFIFNDITIYDTTNDTLFYVKTVILNTNILKFLKDSITINKVHIEYPLIKINAIDSINYNYTFLQKLFESNNNSKRSSRLSIKLKKFIIKNGSLIINTNSANNNFKKFYIKKLNLHVSNFLLKEDIVALNINKLTFRERYKNLKLKNFSANIVKDNKKTKIEKLIIEANNSFLFLNKLIFKYKKFNDLIELDKNTKIYLDIKNSSIYLKDLSIVSTVFEEFTNEKFSLSGIIKGNLSNLKTNNLLISLSNKTYVKGNYNIIDITKPDKTFFVFNFDTLSVFKNDIKFLEKFINKSILDLASEINTVFYKGNILGFLNNFVTSGYLETNIGKVNSNVKIIIDTLSKTTTIDGSISTEDFNIAKIIKGKNLFGNISFKGNLNLIIGQKGFKGNGKLSISKVFINNYLYSNIETEGNFTDKYFDGSFSISDPNIKFSFIGKVDFSSKLPVLNFMADFKYIKLNNLNIVNPDSQYTLSFMIDSKITGKDISNIYGNLNIYQAKFYNKNKEYNLNDISINISSLNDKHLLKVNSDFVIAEISGEFSKEKLLDNIKAFLLPYLKIKNFNDNIKMSRSENFDLKVKLIQLYHPLLSYFFPIIHDFSGLNLKIFLSNNHYETNIKTDSLVLFNNIKLTNINLESFIKKDSLVFSLSIDSVVASEKNRINNIILHNYLKNNEISTVLKIGNNSSLIKESIVTLNSHLSENIYPIFFVINPSYITIMNEKIFINKSQLALDTTKINVKHLSLNTLNQGLEVTGNIGADYSDSLRIIFKNILLSQLNIFTSDNNFTFNGKVNGSATILSALKTPIVIGNLNIDTLTINNENFGRFEINASWNKHLQRIDYKVKSYRGKIKTIDAEGHYDNENNIYANIFLDKWRLNLLEPFVKSFSSEIKGNLSGNLKITGKINKPEINGTLNLVKAAIKIDYLNTRYNFTGDVNVTSNAFELNNIDLYDSDGNIAKLNGKITHNYFSNIYVDFNINTQKFMCLNTKPSPEQLYFGTVFTTGIVNIHGFVDKIINIEANVQTDKGSIFFLNLESTEELSERPYIKFVSSNKIAIEERKSITTEDLGLTLNFNIQATPYANVELIFDSKTNDILKAKGTGNLRLQLSNKGIFTIYGNYEIQEGNYMFSIRNLVKKEFNIVEGSNITFNGDPLNAAVNVKTLYKIRTNLIELMLDSTYRERTTVNCFLNLSGKLTQPVLNFQIEIPGADSKVTSVLNSLTEEEKSKQFISLLVLNKFITPELYRGGIKTTDYNPIGANTSEYFTNQINNWLNSISKNVNVKINYRPGSELSNEEMAIALNTQILNDRISIHTNFGMSNSNQPDQSYLIGDFEMNAIISKNKKLRMKVFNRTNNRIFKENSPYTQGIGISYSDEFNSFKDLYQRLFAN
ncbi:MAG: translocation/assembly module TamB domain-containing protein [Bacteroidales bacterium]|nr:translocation/assembly module TamB domain-containing protein [Bacteroidales bacterium]